MPADLFFTPTNKRKMARGHARLENSSLFAVTGICLVEPGDWQAGRNLAPSRSAFFSATPDDVVVLCLPSWWILKRMLWVQDDTAL